MNSEIGSPDFPECEKFPARLRDLCECRGREGRRHPQFEKGNEFRIQNGLEPLGDEFRPRWGGSFGFNRGEIVQATDQAARNPRPRPQTPRKPEARVGDELKAIFASLGVNLPNCFTCSSVGSKMNALGIEGCRRERDEIIAGIKERAKTVSITQWATAAANAIATGLVFSVNPLDPIPGLYDEAIRRAEEKLNQASAAVAGAETK